MTWLHVALIPLLPALAAVLMIPLPRSVRNRLLWLPTLATAASTVLSGLFVSNAFFGAPSIPKSAYSGAWRLAVIGGEALDLSLRLDGYGIIMLVVVTVVSLLVHIYSLSYMGEDKRRGWYFTVLALFTAAMLGLVVSDNLLLTFAMWELMGLCSYFLIGFWWEEAEPRRAAQKAFLTTRVGDLGFLVALFALFANFGTFDMSVILGAEYAPAFAALVSLAILFAAMGKSAQIGLHAWLPDAMAGPTPSSALIHAATMVAAGVFVVARFMPVFLQAPDWVLTAVLVIGAATAIMAASIAATQHDIKKVLAYSTISQLGLMFVALGLGSAVVAIFHLFTHAFFKALLFMTSGVVIHATHSQDMRDMGGLRKAMPATTVIYTIGALALAGIAPLSGFFSKDEILTVAAHADNWWAYGAVAVTSLLTAFYMTRLWIRVFGGKLKDESVHEGPGLMVVPVAILAAITLVAGFTFIPMADFVGEHGAWPQLDIALASTAVALGGIVLGYLVFGRSERTSRNLKKVLGPLYQAPARLWYFDEVYDNVVIKGYFGLSKALWWFDRTVVDGIVNGAAKGYELLSVIVHWFDAAIVDGIVNSLAGLARLIGSGFRALQTGRLQTYQRYALAAVVLFMVYVLVKGAFA